jgi:hypothetical protein
MELKMLSPWTGADFMGAKIANRAIVAVQIIRWMAIIIVMGMILTIVAASIYGSLGTTH